MFKVIAALTLLAASAPAAPRQYPPQIDGAREEVYREVDGVKLKVWIFEPEGGQGEGAGRPAVVFFFGGGWTGGSPVQFEPQCRQLAGRGMVAMTADYRVASRHGAKAADCVTDAKACVAWIRGNAKRLGIDPHRIAAGGGSAGGHIAACTGTVPGFGADERPDAMILFNPALVLAPWQGRDLGGFGARVPESRLGAKPTAISPVHHVGKDTPPTLVLHGEADTTVPYATAAMFAEAMKDNGRQCRLVGYPDQPHGFFNREPWRERTMREVERFLAGLGWID